MSKKKEKSESILSSVDEKLKSQYGEIIRDIEEIQYQIEKADRKKQKKAKKKMKKKGKIMFYDTKSKKARIKAANKITGDKIVSTIINILQEIRPIAVLLARLVAGIICAILSLDIVKRSISPSVLDKMKKLFNACMGVTQSQISVRA